MTYNTDRRAEIIAFFKERSEEGISLGVACRELLPDGGGKSTLYRIVSQLCEEGILKKLSDERSRHCKYQYVGDAECHSHLHLKCRGCGRLIHLDFDKSHELSHTLLRMEGFTPDSGSFIFGMCKNCRL